MARQEDWEGSTGGLGGGQEDWEEEGRGGEDWEEDGTVPVPVPKLRSEPLC